MEIGEYIRNKYGIAKVIDIENYNGLDILVLDNNIVFAVDTNGNEIKDMPLMNRLPLIENIDLSKRKHSKKIIDLIEVGDYVNGSKVVDIVYAPIKAIYTEDIKQKSALIPYEKEKINSILTKEQFESMEYKL